MAIQIKDYPKYTITESGEVYSTKWGYPKQLKPQRASQSKKGYVQVRLFNKEYPKGRLQYIHRLVYESFRGDIPNDYELDHIDNNPRNNNLSNLQLITRRANGIKSTRDNHGIHLRDYRDEICNDYKTLGTFKKVGEKWGKSIPAISRVVRNKSHYYDRIAGKYRTKTYDENISDEFTFN
jgi:hypothetical protein